MNKQPEHPYKVRIPFAVWKDLEQMAKDEERSINWEIVKAISERIVRHQKGKKRHGQEEN